MRRFDYDENEDHREDVDGFLGGEGEEGGEYLTPEQYQAIVEEDKALQKAQMDLVNRELNERLMGEAVKMLEKSWCWRFYSLDTKLRMIQRAFLKMRKIAEHA